jgi:methyl coenzyme M reductase alpha subunit
LVGVVIVLVVGAGIRACDHPAAIYYFHTVDQHTLVVGTDTGPWSWTRVTGVSETPTTITVWVSSLELPLPGADARHVVELVVKLHDPIGNRAEVAGSGGVRFTGT